MAKSMGEALKRGQPVVFTRNDDTCPEVVCEPGRENEALELLAKMKKITLIRPDDGNRPKGTLKTFDEQRVLSDEEILEEHGWTMECQSPFEMSHKDGSRATGQGAYMILRQIREGVLE
jgi:hypothetical protein